MLNNILHRLNAEFPGALKSMHNAVGFDYNRPMYAFRIEGKFTLSRIWKETNLHPGLYEIAVLLKQSARRWSTDQLHYIRLTGPKEYELKPDRMNCFPGPKKRRSPIDTYFRKGDFEEDRKIADYAYIIAQLREDLSPLKEKAAVELFHRYADKPRRNECYGYMRNWEYYEIDKSGYPVEKKRDELKHRAELLRTQRQKERADAADFTDRMEGTRTNFEILRTECIKALSFAIGESLWAVKKAVDELYWIERYFRIAEDKTNEKKWRSVDQAKTEWDEIAAKIAAARNELRDAVWPEETESKESAIA